MKTLLIFLFASIAFTTASPSWRGGGEGNDSTFFIKEIDEQIIEKDSLINYLQVLLIKDAFDKNIPIQIGNKKYFFRDEIMKREQLDEIRKLYVKEYAAGADSAISQK